MTTYLNMRCTVCKSSKSGQASKAARWRNTSARMPQAGIRVIFKLFEVTRKEFESGFVCPVCYDILAQIENLEFQLKNLIETDDEEDDHGDDGGEGFDEAVEDAMEFGGEDEDVFDDGGGGYDGESMSMKICHVRPSQILACGRGMIRHLLVLWS